MHGDEDRGSLSRRQWLGGVLLGAAALSAGLLQGCGRSTPPAAARPPRPASPPDKGPAAKQEAGPAPSEGASPEAKAPAQVYKCSVCGYEYDPAEGDPRRGTAPGTRFEDLPDDWTCPRCGSAKAKFRPKAG